MSTRRRNLAIDPIAAPGRGTVDADNVPRELLLARWTLQRMQDCLEELEAALDDDGPRGHERWKKRRHVSPPRQIVQAMRRLLALDHELTLRIDRLLLWLDHRRAWSRLGYRNAVDFGLHVLDDSPATTRNRLRLARAQEGSAAESGHLSHERLVRLAGLWQRKKLDEDATRKWVDHAAAMVVEKLDHEMSWIARRRIENPLPLSDEEWQASLRLVPGEARRNLLTGGLEALATEAPINVFLRIAGPADAIRDLRHGLNETRVRLAARGPTLDELAPSDAARLFPSLRLAQRYATRGKRIPDWVCLLSMLEEFAEEWDDPRRMPRRRAILERDGYQCTVPGCTARSVEDHHIEYRSRGGGDELSNRTALCGFHHRMGEHGTLLTVTGTAPLGLTWKLPWWDAPIRNGRLGRAPGTGWETMWESSGDAPGDGSRKHVREGERSTGRLA